MAEDRVEIGCNECGQKVAISQRWTPGGVNDKGGWVLKCSRCLNVFEFYLGRDINDSRVISGASVVETYDVEIESRESVLRRFNLKLDGEKGTT